MHNTNFYEVEGQSRVNPATAGMELNEADYDEVLQVGHHKDTERTLFSSLIN